MVWLAVLSRFFILTYAGFVVGAFVWFFVLGDGSLREIRNFTPALFVSMMVAFPSVLVWLFALVTLKLRGFVFSDIGHALLALGIGVIIVGIVGGWIWFEQSKTTSVLGRSLLQNFILPSLVMAVVSVPLAFMFKRFRERLKLESLF